VRPWGFFATLGWGVPIAVTSLIIRDVVSWSVFRTVFLQSPSAQLRPLLLADLTTVFVQTALTLAVVKLRRGFRIADYFALHLVPWRTALAWIASGIAAASLVTIIRRVTNGPAPNIDLFTQDGFTLYLVTIIVLIPISEELFDRGFILTGLRETRFRDALAIPVGAALWALAHANRAWQGFAALFLLACLLGVTRKSTNSILPGVLVHAVQNSLAIGILIVDGVGPI